MRSHQSALVSNHLLPHSRPSTQLPHSDTHHIVPQPPTGNLLTSNKPAEQRRIHVFGNRLRLLYMAFAVDSFGVAGRNDHRLCDYAPRAGWAAQGRHHGDPTAGQRRRGHEVGCWPVIFSYWQHLVCGNIAKWRQSKCSWFSIPLDPDGGHDAIASQPNNIG